MKLKLVFYITLGVLTYCLFPSKNFFDIDVYMGLFMFTLYGMYFTLVLAIKSFDILKYSRISVFIKSKYTSTSMLSTLGDYISNNIIWLLLCCIVYSSLLRHQAIDFFNSLLPVYTMQDNF